MADTTGASDQSLAPPDAVPDMQPTDEARAAAPGGWFTCTIDRAGPSEDGTVAIRLKESSKGQFYDYYVAAPSSRREMLATALAALTSDKAVVVSLTTTARYGVINHLWLGA